MNWSKHEREEFISSDGVGFGAYTVFDAVPGSWNILALTCPALDDPMLCYSESGNTFLTPSIALATAIGLALQFHDGEGVSFGHLATVLSPQNFVRLLKSYDQKLIPVTFFGSVWLEFVAQRAEEFSVTMSKTVIKRVDFKNRIVVQ